MKGKPGKVYQFDIQLNLASSQHKGLDFLY